MKNLVAVTGEGPTDYGRKIFNTKLGENQWQWGPVKELLEKYCESRACPAPELEQTSDSAALYRRIQNGEQWDVYILDILMSEKTGIDIGGLLHRTGAKSPIIYVTSSDDFALAAYGVHAVRYLLKPVREEDFFEALDYAMSYKQDKRDSGFLVKPISFVMITTFFSFPSAMERAIGIESAIPPSK